MGRLPVRALLSGAGNVLVIPTLAGYLILPSQVFYVLLLPPPINFVVVCSKQQYPISHLQFWSTQHHLLLTKNASTQLFLLYYFEFRTHSIPFLPLPTRLGSNTEIIMDNQKRTESSSTPLLLSRRNYNDVVGSSHQEEERQHQITTSSSSSSIPLPPATLTLTLTTLVAVFGSYVFGTAIGYSSPTQSQIMLDLNLGVAQFSIFGSILTIGAMIGAIFSGKIADFAGRRLAMGFSQLFCILGWIAVAFSKDAWWLYIGRLLVGCGIGLLSYVVPVYVAEITPKNLRGAFTTVHQLMICVGMSLTYLIGAFVNWRSLAIIGTIPCLVQLLCLPFIPDSPRWLAKVGRLKESDSSLQRLRGKNADIYKEATEIRDYTEALQQQTEASITGLFKLQYLKSLTVGVGLMILQQFGGINGIVFYANSIFISAGFSQSIGTIAMVAVKIPMTTLGVLLMDRSGRRPLLLLSAVGTCLGCFLAALSFFLQDIHKLKEVSPILALVGVLVYVGSYSLGMGAIPWVIMSEIFPINVKGSAGSFVTLINWLCSWIVSYGFNFLMSWSSTGTFSLFSAICGFTILFVAKLVPETKGRTLEEIQASLSSYSTKR